MSRTQTLDTSRLRFLHQMLFVSSRRRQKKWSLHLASKTHIRSCMGHARRRYRRWRRTVWFVVRFLIWISIHTSWIFGSCLRWRCVGSFLQKEKKFSCSQWNKFEISTPNTIAIFIQYCKHGFWYWTMVFYKIKRIVMQYIGRRNIQERQRSRDRYKISNEQTKQQKK